MADEKKTGRWLFEPGLASDMLYTLVERRGVRGPREMVNDLYIWINTSELGDPRRTALSEHLKGALIGHGVLHLDQDEDADPEDRRQDAMRAIEWHRAQIAALEKVLAQEPEVDGGPDIEA